MSDLRVDRQEFHEVRDEPPAEPRFGLVPIADGLAVPHCPDNPTIRVKKDAVAVGGRDAGRHVGRQPLGELRAFDTEAGFGVDHCRSRIEVEAADENGPAVVLLARCASVVPPLAAMRGILPMNGPTLPTLLWGGLRGGISVAMALSLPESPKSTIILTATYMVVLFSVIIQGGTIARVVERSQAKHPCSQAP